MESPEDTPKQKRQDRFAKRLVIVFLILNIGAQLAIAFQPIISRLLNKFF